MGWEKRLRRVVLAGLLAAGPAAQARALQVIETTPPANAVVDGRHARYVVRFDLPVDHFASRLEILRDGAVVRHLHPLEDSAPEVLFGSGPQLPPGRYELRWTALTRPGGEASTGTVAFSVGQ